MTLTAAIIVFGSGGMLLGYLIGRIHSSRLIAELCRMKRVIDLRSGPACFMSARTSNATTPEDKKRYWTRRRVLVWFPKRLSEIAHSNPGGAYWRKTDHCVWLCRADAIETLCGDLFYVPVGWEPK